MGSKRRRSTASREDSVVAEKEEVVEEDGDGDDDNDDDDVVEYYIRPLSVPMYISRTGEPCSFLHISRGTVLCIGRSRKWCDLVFEDSRVSRRHCHIQVLSHCHGLILSHGPPPKKVIDENTISGSPSYKPSLNGIFVNGHELMGRSMALKCGDEVSLVGPTQAGKCLELDCQLAVGFIVVTHPQASSIVKKRWCDPNQVCSQIDSIGEEFTCYKRVSMSPAYLSPSRGFSWSDCNSAHIGDAIQNQPIHEHLVKTEAKNFNIIDTTILKSASDSCWSARSTGEEKLKLEPLNIFSYNKEHFIIQHLNDITADFSEKSIRHANIIQCPLKERSVSVDLDNKLHSAFNLVKASIELRTSLLNESKSHPHVGKGEPVLSVAESKDYQTSKEDMQSHILFQNNYSSGLLTMDTVDVYDKFAAYEKNAFINNHPEQIVTADSYLKVGQVDYENSLKMDLAAKEKCSVRGNTINNLCLSKVENEITCHIPNYATKCPMKEDLKPDKGKVLYGTPHKELSIKDHIRTADTQFIEKDRFSEHMVKILKQCTPELKRMHSVMSFETEILHFGDEHYLTTCKNACNEGTALPERNSRLLLKGCDRTEDDHTKTCQFTETPSSEESLDRACKLRCFYEESQQTLENQQLDSFGDDTLTHIEVRRETPNTLQYKKSLFEVDGLAAVRNISHLTDMQSNGETLVEERTNNLSRPSYIEDTVQVRERYHFPDLNMVIPKIIPAFNHKGCSQTLVDELQQNEEIERANGKDMVSKSGYSLCRKGHYRISDTVVCHTGSRCTCDTECAEIIPKSDLCAYVAQDQNLKCTQSKEHHKKKEHNESRTYIKLRQKVRKTHSSLQIHESFIEDDRNSKINYQRKEQFEDKFMRKCTPYTSKAAGAEINPKVDCNGCVAEAQNLNCSKIKEQYKKKEHDQSGSYTKCTQEKKKKHSSLEIYELSVEDDHNLKINSRRQEQFKDPVLEKGSLYTSNAECSEINLKVDLHGCVVEAQNLKCMQSEDHHKTKEDDQSGLYSKLTREERKNHSSLEVDEPFADNDQNLKINFRRREQYEDKVPKKGSSYACNAACPEINPNADAHGCVVEAQILECIESEEQCKKKEHNPCGIYTKCMQEERKKQSSHEVCKSLVENDQNLKINCQRKEKFESKISKQGSPYKCIVQCPEINPNLNPHVCVAEVQNLKCFQSDEHYKKRQLDQSGAHIKCTQEEWTQDSPREKHKSLFEADQNLKINSLGEEQLQGTGVDVSSYNTNSCGYFLNQLKDIPDRHCTSVSLEDLFKPIDDVQALFITTFTYDVEWFLAFSGISSDIPITVACHNAQRCFSPAVEDRCEKPYVDWPNVTLVYPPFPKSSLIGKGRGIGCHHPKVFLQYRTESIRVIVSSANLSFKQWFQVTNNVWWQDFPRRQIPDFQSLFRQEISTTVDFASQLASFLANILQNAPSEAHWITDLAAFDFSLATGYLVASIPGIHHRMYENAPQFLPTLEKDLFSLSRHDMDYSHKNLGIVACTVAGVKYRFCATADQNGSRIRSLAAVLNDLSMYNGSTMPVLLKRAKYLKADPNAVSVVVTSQALCSSQDLFLQENLHNSGINTMESVAIQNDEGFIKLGFLPRDIAGWLALLCDKGFFSFAACIWPSEALAVASGQSDAAVKLALYVFQGPKFSTLSTTDLTNEELTAIGQLLKSLHNIWGMWRLEHLLSRYKWIDSHESDFFVGSSSIGTSLDAKFLAAFAAASGQRADSSSCSQDSDPEWGCWTAEHEAMNPSIGIVFPTIDRVKQNLSHYGILCFAESAWIRLKSARLLHDAVPHPPQREGFPMHIKVARRRFQESPTSRPYGWLYCGSHNFSPAAWGRPAWVMGDSGNVLGSSLQISNYELGIVLVEPPPSPHPAKDGHEHGHEHGHQLGIDRFILPFKVPPPLYTDSDRPATRQAINEAYLELRAMQLKIAEEMNVDIAGAQVSEDEIPEEVITHQQQEVAACNSKVEEAKAEQVYVEALWSQIEDENG